MIKYDITCEFLGQKIFKTRLSDELVNSINERMDLEIKNKQTVSAIPILSGKIKGEYRTPWVLDIDKDNEIVDIVKNCLDNSNKDEVFNKVTFHGDNIWINDQLENEYQTVHKHSGHSITGVSTILYLRVPDLGPEFTHTDKPTNGRTTFIGNVGGQFVVDTVTIDPVVGDFYVFPYDMKHVVYPFRGNGVRRSLSANFDVFFEKTNRP